MKQSDPASALREAFAQLLQLGQRSGYGRSYGQFRLFMRAAKLYAETEGALSGTPRSAQELIIDLVSHGFEGNPEERRRASDWIQANLSWVGQSRTACAAVSRFDEHPTAPGIRVLKGDTYINTLFLPEEDGVASISGLEPGEYALLLETGRLIWQGRLTERQLIWAGAFPNQPLDLAAATGDVGCPSTVEERLLDGELVLRVFPGMETGRMEIKRTIAGAV